MCSLLASVTVLCTKGLSTAFVLTIRGDDQMLHYLPWVLLITAAVTIVLTVRFLNAAMGNFGASTVVPVYYVLFSFAAVGAGIIVLREFSEPFPWSFLVFAASCLVTFSELGREGKE